MNLVLLTVHYPFGNQETFLESEIKLIADLFDKIFIATFAKERRITKYMPDNSELILLRGKRFSLTTFLKAFASMIHPRIFIEWKFARNKLQSKNNFIVFRQIFMYQYFYFLIRSKLKKYLPESKTIFYSYWLGPGAYALAEIKRNGEKIISISRAHGGDAFIERGYKPFRRELLTYLDEIHFVSSAGMESVQKNILPHVSNLNAKVFVSRLGVQKKADSMNPTFESMDMFNIVSCSNIIRLKRLDLLIEALSHIKGQKIVWTHFGDGELRNDIEKMAKEAFLGKKISAEFMGYIGNDEIHQYYLDNSINLFVNVSDYEGIPVSIMEAMSYGIPVIARDIGGNKEIVKNNVNGILLNSEITSYDLAEGIMKIIKLSRDEYNLLCMEAYNTFISEYNAEFNYRAFGNHLKEQYNDQYL